jgi:hypothetical protein
MSAKAGAPLAPGALSASPGHIEVAVPARDFSLDWRRFNLVANYIAEYASYFFEHKDSAENLISSVFYELLEYMAGISREDAHLRLRLVSADGRLVFEISSSGVDATPLALHQKLIAGLDCGDREKIYRDTLEAGPHAGDVDARLGLAMLAHDYHASISTRVDDSGSVVLLVSLGNEELSS